MATRGLSPSPFTGEGGARGAAVGGRGLARLLALLVPATLLAGALGSQYLGGLHPCEMCHWQRWPHYAALPLAALAFAVPRLARPLVALAAPSQMHRLLRMFESAWNITEPVQPKAVLLLVTVIV